uniref:Uncharacterized protein n=1 Tax=viral metagenome TaxID=1070528 RepID=A0A6C0KDZ7_9ZZZZ
MTRRRGTDHTWPHTPPSWQRASDEFEFADVAAIARFVAMAWRILLAAVFFVAYANELLLLSRVSGEAPTAAAAPHTWHTSPATKGDNYLCAHAGLWC